jgi:alkyl hydroperoxide reductase subunit AhpF
MSLLSDREQQQVSELFEDLTRPVRLLLFTQTFGCETCGDARRVLDALAEISDKVTVDECNLVLDADRAARYGVDRAPSTAVLAFDGEEERDYGVRFVGLTAGYEFSSLIDAILLVSSGTSGLSEESRSLIASVKEPVDVRVFVTPT